MQDSSCLKGEKKPSPFLKRVKDFFSPTCQETIISDDQWHRNCQSLVTQYNDLLASFNGLKNELTQIQRILESKQAMGNRITSCLARINSAKSSLNEFFPKGERL